MPCYILVYDLDLYNQVSFVNKITTVDLEYNIRLKVEVKSDDIVDPLTEIALNPALMSEEASGGLCGKWSHKNEIPCNFIDKEGECVKLGQTEKIMSYWRYILILLLYFLYSLNKSIDVSIQ